MQGDAGASWGGGLALGVGFGGVGARLAFAEA
jgi:hypothetical protein